jgi:2-dehydro-3-deoxyglucarate aldolase
MKSKTLKEKLKKNELTIGSWITIGHPAIPEILSHAKFDWLVIDIEHTTIDLSMVQTLISTIQSVGISAIVRVSKNEEVVIKRVLDAGADGIIIPMVNSQADAEKAINYVKYPPNGSRGVGLARAQAYGYKFEEYKSAVNDLIVIAQIEHFEGIDNLDSILSVSGIDGSIIGPYDLTGSLGVPGDFNDLDFKQYLKTYKQVSELAHQPMGFHVVESRAEEVKAKISEGYTFIAFGTDFFFMGDRSIEEMRIIRED